MFDMNMLIKGKYKLKLLQKSLNMFFWKWKNGRWKSRVPLYSVVF